MPSYNTANFIAEAVDSVQHQTYTNWELVIVDDCSIDNTDKVVSKYLNDSRIKYFKNKNNYGAAVCRNYAILMANGRWIAFLDSDDLWLPEKLEMQIKFMEKNDYHFTYTNYEEIDENGKALGFHVSGPKRIKKLDMYNYCWPGCLTVMYDREKIGLIQIKDIKKNNDYAMWLLICKKNDCMLLNKELAKYRRRRDSISRHSIKTMVGWHYKLWHEVEHKNVEVSLWYTCLNIVYGFYKKIRYVKNDSKN